jgi:cation-transporting ATPase E
MSWQVRGLSPNEVLKRRAEGLGNNVPLQTTRSYFQILRENVFTFINNVLFALGIALVLLGRASDALVSVVVISINVVVSVIQEVRAKRTLDRIALLARPTATVIRDGREQAVDPGEIVVGDVLVVGRGDQVVVDGQVVEGHMDADESLLTGESDPIPKGPGDPVYSGSFCVTGSALYEAHKVGEESLTHRLTAGARAFRRVLTPLQGEINLVIRGILLVALLYEFLLIVKSVLSATPFVESVRMSVVVVGLVPNGLFLAISVAYALAAVRIAGRGALVQQINAIESLSNVDVLCLDKTGTLTTNRIQFHELYPLIATRDELEHLLGDFAANVSGGNRTSEAIGTAFPGRRRSVIGEVPFSSELKWSALAVEDGERQAVYVLGAPEILQPVLRQGSNPVTGRIQALDDQLAAWVQQGLRVLLFASHPGPVPLYDKGGQPCLPAGLSPLGLISLSDELRPEVRATINDFVQAGVRLKIISGDNPDTVAALARQAGMAPDLQVVSGLELANMDSAQVTQTAVEATILGRISPLQKQQIIQALRHQGNYVAMIGDGVNDVLSLKQAQLGIALQSGSQATRSVADIVLLGDRFSSLSLAVQEGQRIVQGMQDILKLFLTRVFYVALLIPAAAIIGAFPFAPKQTSILVFFTVGLPTIALAAWARPAPRPRGTVMRRLLHFVLPAVLTMSVAAVLVFAGYLTWTRQALSPTYGETAALESATFVAQTALTVFSVLCGILLIPFVEPPSESWVGGDVLSGDWRPTILAALLLIVFLAGMAVPGLGAFFELAPLSWIDYLILCGATLLWGLLLRWMWRARLLDRFLHLDA